MRALSPVVLWVAAGGLLMAACFVDVDLDHLPPQVPRPDAGSLPDARPSLDAGPGDDAGAATDDAPVDAGRL